MTVAKTKKTKNITGNDRVYTNLEQYILTQNLSKISKIYDNEAANNDEFKYCTFRQVNGPGSQLINRLRGIDDLSVFYKIKTSTLSLLQPKIRLYKVIYEDFQKDGNGKPDLSTVRPLPVPCYKEFKFSDNFGVETAASVQEYLKYESTKPSFRNAGLTRFTMTQNGETHGTIENNIECKLELKFKSLKDINASPPGEAGLRYVDLILWPPARVSEGGETYNSKHYEIKALIGYAAPTDKQLHALSIPQREIDAVRDIEKMNQIVALGMYDYDIKIAETGVIDVTISFRGRLETVIGSNQVNVFQDSIRIGDAGQFELVRKAKSDMNLSHVYKLASSIKGIYAGLNDARCKSACDEKTNLKKLTESDLLLSILIKDAVGESNSDLSAIGLRKKGKKLKVLSGPEAQKYYDWFKKLTNTRRILTLLKEKVGIFKQQIYTGFIDMLVETHNPKADPPEVRFNNLPPTRIYCAIADEKEVKESVGVIASRPADPRAEPPPEGSPPGTGLLSSQTEINETIKRFGDDVAAGADMGFQFKRCGEGIDDLKKMTEEAVKAASVESAPDASAGQDSENTEEEEKVPMGVAPSWMYDGTYKFYFVFLGDIIELACKNARLGALPFKDFKPEKTIFPWSQYQKVEAQDAVTSYPLVNARILIGPVEYVDGEGQIQTTNLAKIPISFAYFRSWFFEKIIKRRRAQMPLGAFLSSLINDLVIPALGVDMPRSFKPPHTRASIISLSLPGVVGKATHKICDKNVPSSEEAMPMVREIFTESPDFSRDYLSKIVGRRESESMLQTSYDYLLMYITSFKDMVERKADPAEDIKDGIYHFNIGSDMGLLRTMDFNRVNIPGLAELRSAQSEELGLDQLQQLKLPYDTNVNLVGTSLFTPGMYYYVNQSLAGLGSVKDASSLAYQMNLGGYHLIGQVSTQISAGRFETQIIGTQTAQGKR